MSFHRFQSFDPYLSFAEGQKGFEEKIFVRPDGEPTERWYGKDRDGKGYLSSMWRIGRDAYATIADKIGEQPSTEFFEETAKDIRSFEKDLLPSIQSFIECGQLKLLEDRDSAPVEDLKALTDAPDGWLTEVYMRIVMPLVVAGEIPEADVADFEGLLLAAAVLYIDDYIIAAQIGHAVDTASDLVTTNIGSAKLYRETVDAAKAAVSAVGRRSAKARHAPTNQNKAAAVADWKTEGHKFSSMRAFARECFKRYEVRDYMTVYNWLREDRKAKT